MKNVFGKTSGIAAVSAVLSTGVLSGCAGTNDGELQGLLSFPEMLTATQARWLVFLETFLILLLVSVIVLLIFLFRRYRKIEKRAVEAGMREQALMKENEMLSRLDRMKTEFLQNMSHDFKTPLAIISTSVLNAMDMLDHEFDKDELQESLILAQSETLRMSRVLDSAIKLSDQKNSQPVNIPRFLKKVEKIFRMYLEKHGNTIKTYAPKTLPQIYYDSDSLLNILSNLISNANRYTRNGEIFISAEETDEKHLQRTDRKFVTITVSDTGMGIDPAILPDVFKRGTSKTKNRTGLGLPICKAAVESFGGTITIDSVYGKGTKVVFTAPVYDGNKTGTDGRTEEK